MQRSETASPSRSTLASDVSFLGRVLGEVLREQGGEPLFDAVEDLRLACRALRSRPSRRAEADIEERIAALPLPLALDVVRAFTMYFHLINMAEENQRLRRIAEREVEDRPRDESIGSAIRALRESAVPENDVRGLLQDLAIRPVITAHPTEARRMTVLRQLRRIYSLVEVLTGGRLTPVQRERAVERLYAAVTNLWQTSELRAQQQTVMDEVRNGLFYFDDSIFDVVPALYRDLHDALRRDYPALAEETFDFLTFGSWIGGDRDGNPNVTTAQTGQAIRLHRALIVVKYGEKVRRLFGEITPSSPPAAISPEMATSLQRDVAELGDSGAEFARRWQQEPYRLKLACIGYRLENTYRRNGVEWRGNALPTTDGPGYDSAGRLLDDLEVMAASLRANRAGRIADGALLDLIRQVRVFGFHLVRLDIRQHRDRHLQALDEILPAAVPFSRLDEESKVALLESVIRKPPPVPTTLSDATRETIATFDVVRRMQREMGRDAVDTYIISMSQEPSDVLAVLFLARVTVPADSDETAIPLRIAPLFETEDDLQRAPAIMDRLYRSDAYRRHLAAWNREQEIMLGYSDSDKDAGYVTSNWSLYRAQQSLTRQARAAGIRLVFFHGRGGAIGRGGGPLQRAILGQPAGTVNGRLKVTEQGEVLFTRYANPGIAHRHLEQLTNAVLRHSSPSLSPLPAGLPDWEDLAAELSTSASAAYQALVRGDPDFITFFDEGTPLRSIMRLRIASRPPRRGQGRLQLSDLRAIPWVFAWTQSRFGLPGWYGLGAALNTAIDGGRLEDLRRMYREWDFFRWLLDAAQISLGKADLAVAQRYSTLVTDEAIRNWYFDLLRAEFDRTIRSVNAVAGQDRLLDGWPVLQRSIGLRNPYVDPMSFIQVRAIRDVRSESDEARAGVFRSIIDHSVAGIAAGLQNTG